MVSKLCETVGEFRTMDSFKKQQYWYRVYKHEVIPFIEWYCLYQTPNSLHLSALTLLVYFQLAILEIAD